MDWVLRDIIIQFVMGIVICFICFLIWKITHKGEKL